MNLRSEFERTFLKMWSADRLPDPGMSVERDGPVCRYVGEGKDAFMYSISLIEPCRDPEKLREIVRREKALAVSRGRDHEWKVYEFPEAPELDRYLEEAGYPLNRKYRLMFAPCDHSVPMPDSTELQLVDAQSPSDLQALETVASEVWGKPMGEVLRLLDEELQQPESLVDVFLAQIGNQVVAGGWIKAYSEIGFLFGGSTLKAYRGRGAYRALVSARLDRANCDSWKKWDTNLSRLNSLLHSFLVLIFLNP